MQWQATARTRSGVVRSDELGKDSARTARRAGLVAAQPRVWLAATQPVGAPEQVTCVEQSVQGDHAFTDLTALWLYGLRPAPESVRVGVPHGTRYRVRPPVRTTRLSPAVLRGCRTRNGSRVVALEVAVVQAAAVLSQDELLDLVEHVLRERLTSLARLRGRCRRGVTGSRAVRAAVDLLLGTSLDGAVRELVQALTERGVTGLRTEVRFTNEAGASAYADVLDDASASVLEVDGFLTHTERQRFRADRRRDRWMHSTHGLVTFRIDVDEVRRDLPALADELADLLLRRRAAAA